MNKILLISVFTILTLNVMAQEKIVQTAGRTQLGEFAPKFAELNDDVLFGEVWSRHRQTWSARPQFSDHHLSH